MADINDIGILRSAHQYVRNLPQDVRDLNDEQKRKLIDMFRRIHNPGLFVTALTASEAGDREQLQAVLMGLMQRALGP
jgi:hypothetical protein